MAAFAPSQSKDETYDVSEPMLRRPRDIIFVLDSSGSISEEDFDRALKFTRRIVGLLDISQTKTRVAMVNYGTKAKVEFSLHHFSQEQEIQKAITRADPLGGNTNTSEALEKALKICERRHNTSNPLIIILITDGYSDNRARTNHVATTLKQQWGAHFFAVGVGSAVNQTELSHLASSKENVLLVDNYRALKTVREKVAAKACTVVRRPKFFENVTSLGPISKILFVGSAYDSNEDVPTDYEKVIQYIRNVDKSATRTEIIYLTRTEDSKISGQLREHAKSQNIVLLGSASPLGCPEQPETSELDIYATAFFQNILHTPLLNNITHILGHSSATSNAMHNIADVIEQKNQTKVKRILMYSKDKFDEESRKCLELCDVILCTSGPCVAKDLLAQNFSTSPIILPFNLYDTCQAECKEFEDNNKQQEGAESSEIQESTKTDLSDPQLIFLNLIHEGIKFDIILNSRGYKHEATYKKLQTTANVIVSILEERHRCQGIDFIEKLAREFDIPLESVENWLKFVKTVEAPDRKMLRVEENGELGLRFTVFCVTEESVKMLWKSTRKDKPIGDALTKALETGQVPFETCEVIIKSEKEEIVGSIVLTSAAYVKQVANIITRRKKEQDRKWTTVSGTEKDKKIATEIETRRLQKRWETILEEARSIMGEKGVEALERAREEYDNEAEFIERIETSIEAGSFMQLLKDVMANLCCVM